MRGAKFLVSISIGFLGLLAQVEAKVCVLIGDSQSSVSTQSGLNHSIREKLKSEGIDVLSYSISASSARHWHDPFQNPLRPEVMTGRLVTAPEAAIIPTLKAQSDRSLFQQILDYHQERLGRPVDCVIFQLGDNAPRTGHVEALVNQWKAHSPTSNACHWISPTWSEPDHPQNSYRFKTDERTLAMASEIEYDLSRTNRKCHHQNTTKLGDEFKKQLTAQKPFTTDGLHLNAVGGEKWAQVIAPSIINSFTTPVAPVVEVRPAGSVQTPVVVTTSSDIIIPRTDGPVVVPSETPNLQVILPAEPEREDEERTSEIVLTEPTPAITQQEVQEAVEETPQYQIFELNCRSALNMRNTTSARSALIGQIPCSDSAGNRERVAILEYDEESGWFKVFHSGKAAWVSGEYIRPTDDIIELPHLKNQAVIPGVLKCRSNLNMRRGPSTSHQIKARIPCRSRKKATPVQVHGVDSSTGWIMVEYLGEKGFVHPRYLQTDLDAAKKIVNIVDEMNALQPPQSPFDCFVENPANKDCLSFNPNLYSRPNSAKEIATRIESAGMNNRQKQEFVDLFSPIAVHIQGITGWPASVTLAQIALETNWGRSNVFKNAQNVGGISCRTSDSRASRPLRDPNLRKMAELDSRIIPNFTKQGGTPRINTPCTYPRPKNEGGFYHSYTSVMESVYLYTDNLLRSRFYPQSQEAVRVANSRGQVASSRDVVAGLSAYAIDKNYRNKLNNLISQNNLNRFDRLNQCQ